MQRFALLLVVCLLMPVARADALFMCGPKKPDGTVREGASIKLRSACKPNELQVDPVALGLQGPPGEVGPTGPPGPTGASGVSAIARDAEGRVIGPLWNGAPGDLGQEVVVGTTDVNGMSRVIRTPIYAAGFPYNGTPVVLLFAQSGCSGSSYIETSTYGYDLSYSSTVFGVLGVGATISGAGATLYYPSGLPASGPWLSYARYSPTASSCALENGVALSQPLNGCCFPYTGGFAWAAPQRQSI